MKRPAVLVGLLALVWVVATCGTTSQSGAGDVPDGDAADGSGDADAPSDGSADADDEVDAPDTDTDDDADAPDGSGDANDDVGDTDDAPDAADTADTGETDDAGPYPRCDPDQAGACGEGSACRATCPADGPAIGFCTVPDRDSCGCGATFDSCDTSGTTCLMPSCCDYSGLCVTPDEGDTICDGPFAAHFDCAAWASDGGALPEGRCRDHADCTGGAFCQEPGYEIGCGICMEPEATCESDGDCPVGDRPAICDWSRASDCLCEPATICRPGCTTASDCADGQVCGDDSRCRPSPCDGADDCPAAFACADATCARRACSDDGECPGGHCVNSACYDALGACGFLPP